MNTLKQVVGVFEYAITRGWYIAWRLALVAFLYVAATTADLNWGKVTWVNVIDNVCFYDHPMAVLAVSIFIFWWLMFRLPKLLQKSLSKNYTPKP